MNRFLPYVGFVAIVALGAGVFLWMWDPDRDRIWASFLSSGLVLGVFYLGRRWREVMALLGRRSGRWGANLALLIVVVLGITGALNYLASRHNKRWDLTAAKQFSLSEQTVKILSNLKQDLKVILFQRKEQTQEAQNRQDLLDEYKFQSKRISVEVVDQEREPARSAKYKTATEPSVPFGTVIIDAGGKVERVTNVTEQELTNAIIRVIKEGKKKIYFVEGHREKSIDDSGESGLSFIKTKVSESNYELLKFNPVQNMKEGKIELPSDATAFIVAGPLLDYLPAEIDSFRGYMKRGGKAIFLLDPTRQASTPGLVALVSEWGVDVGDNVVIDFSGVGRLFGYGPDMPLGVAYGTHTITNKFNVATAYPLVRSVDAASPTKEGTTVTTLVSSSPKSWGVSNLERLIEQLQKTGGYDPDAKDKQGPLNLGVAVTLTAEKPAAPPSNGEEKKEAAAQPEKTPQGRAVIVGDSDFIKNGLVGAPGIDNLNLFINMVNWVAEDEDLIAIRPREAEDRRIEFQNQQEQKRVAWLSLVILPLGFVFLGIWVWWERRG